MGTNVSSFFGIVGGPPLMYNAIYRKSLFCVQKFKLDGTGIFEREFVNFDEYQRNRGT